MTTAALTCVVRTSLHAPELLRIRGCAALVRALLEELDRVAPYASGGGALAVSEQLVDELKQLGSRILECAAIMERPTHSGTG